MVRGDVQCCAHHTAIVLELVQTVVRPDVPDVDLPALPDGVQAAPVPAEPELPAPVVHLEAPEQLLAGGGHQVNCAEPAHLGQQLTVRTHIELGRIELLGLVTPRNLQSKL